MIGPFCVSHSLRSKPNFHYWQIPHLQSCLLAKMCFQAPNLRLVALLWTFVETGRWKYFQLCEACVPRGEWKCFCLPFMVLWRVRRVLSKASLHVGAVHWWFCGWKCPHIVHKCSLAFLHGTVAPGWGTRVLEKVCSGMIYSMFVWCMTQG